MMMRETMAHVIPADSRELWLATSGVQVRGKQCGCVDV